MSLVACDDTEDSTSIILAGQMMDNSVAGTMMVDPPIAGMVMVGTPMAGTMMASTPLAGTMVAGTPMAGTPMAGSEITVPDCSMSTAESPCEVSIYAVRQTMLIPNETSVQVQGIVTAIRINDEGNASHIVLQDSTGGPYSGIWVYLNDHDMEALPIFTVGEYLQLAGLVDDHFGQRQINSVTAVSQQVGTPIAPMIVSPADVATNGVSAESMEGVLVTIQQVNVESLNPAAGPGDSDPTNEFVVSGGLRVDDYLFNFTMPMVGEQFTSITGILRLGNDDYKLIPRSVEDLQR